MLIDINTCFGKSPRRRVAYADGVSAARMFDDGASSRTTQDIDWSLDNLLRILDQHSVDRALTYSLRGRLYDFIAGNEETWQTTRRHPRLVPVAMIDPRCPVGCVDEAQRCVDRGFRAFRFFPDEQGWSISGLPFLKVAEALAEHAVAVMLPAGGWGHQAAMAQLLCPLGLTVVAIGTLFQPLAESIAVAPAHDGFFLETSTLFTADAIPTLVARVGAERLMFGSGSPEYYFDAAHNLVTEAGLSDADKSAILAGNALRHLGLEGGG